LTAALRVRNEPDGFWILLGGVERIGAQCAFGTSGALTWLVFGGKESFWRLDHFYGRSNGISAEVFDST
jgi:hypothetical protein